MSLPSTPPPPDFRLDDVPAGSYADVVRQAWANVDIWDDLRYDDVGDLRLGGLRILDAVERFGTPLEIVDTTIVERRLAQWRRLTSDVARAVGYTGKLDYVYAGKANMASEVVHAALRSGWGAETSAAQELTHLAWLADKGLLPPGARVVCNGFKLPPGTWGEPSAAFPADEAPRPVAPPPGEEATLLPADGTLHLVRDVSYADRIIEFAAAGWNILPILDQGEFPYFARAEVPMNVGLRLKFGRVTSEADLIGLVSRFGMTVPELEATADDIAGTGHLTFTTLHAMVGAAETIPVDQFVSSLLVAGGIWSRLKRRHPSLTELNMGGGVPPLAEDYDHRGFLEGLLGGLARLAAAADVPPPDLTFELGSLVAAECGHHVFGVLQWKDNHDDALRADEWAILDGGLMAAIPDMLFLGKPFRFLAVRGGHAPGRVARLGDITCDGDGRYPPISFGPDAAVLLPNIDGPQCVLIQGVGAYQEILSGVRGAHHCGLLEAVELILERQADGRVAGRLMPRQTFRDAAGVLGYVDGVVPALRATMAP